jgi:hypothetical protein
LIKPTKNHCLLLLFKDDLALKIGRGFPLISESRTILRHVAVTDPKVRQLLLDEGIPENILPLQPSLFQEEVRKTDSFWPPAPAENCCVWGWWRKPWEYHPTLFLQIQDYLKGSKTLDTLLYTQYTRRIYRATLYDLYFLPVDSASTVTA